MNAMRMKRYRRWVWLMVVAMLAGVARFYRLGDGVLRSDELNRYLEGRSPVSLMQFWRDWDPTNQIPLQNVLCMGVARLFPEVNEFSLRFIGSLLGIVTVLVLAGWVAARWGWPAGLFLGVWLALNPYHLHESREAYYYGLLMFASSLFSLYTIDRITSIRETRAPMRWREWVVWIVLAVLLCHTHMSTWVYATVFGAALFAVSLPLERRLRWRQMAGLAVSGLVILVFMLRWISDAIGEVRKVSEDTDYTFIGDRFINVAPRVVPMYLGGVNWFGVGMLILTLAAAIAVWRRWRETRKDDRYALLTALTLVSIAVLYAYIGLVGKGVGKETFFSSCWPVLMVWSVVTLRKASDMLREKYCPKWRHDWFLAVAAVFVTVVLLHPAWVIVNLDGKPAPWRQTRDCIDRELTPGSVVATDNWFDSWVQLAIYAPSNAFVTFALPDVPINNASATRARNAIRAGVESGMINAFLTSSRNYLDHAGEWEWAEKFFVRRATVANDNALWLRRHGYSVMSGLYSQNTNRIVMDLYYNRDDDLLDRARQEGRSAIWMFGAGWQYLKPWRMMPGWPEQLLQSVWIQAGLFDDRETTVNTLDDLNRMPQPALMQYLNRGRWADYRGATGTSALRVFNLTDAPMDATLELTAIALSGPVQCRIGETPTVFPPVLLSLRSVPVTLAPGENAIPVHVPPSQMLLVRRVRVKAP